MEVLGGGQVVSPVTEPGGEQPRYRTRDNQGQMYLMDAFFGGQFTTYGSEVLSVTNRDMEKRVDPMAKVFPKVTKCTFHRYGPSGTIVNHDGLCILPINIINEKTYVFLWFCTSLSSPGPAYSSAS